jgi:hypothetical protein
VSAAAATIFFLLGFVRIYIISSSSSLLFDTKVNMMEILGMNFAQNSLYRCSII